MRTHAAPARVARGRECYRVEPPAATAGGASRRGNERREWGWTMTIKEKVIADLTAAMKAKDPARLSVMRMLKARMLEAEVEQRAKKGLDYQLDDGEAQAVIAAYAKQRRDSIDAYRQGGRADLAAKEEAELLIIHEFLPRQLAADEIRAIVREAIADAAPSREMGAVMKRVMPRVKGVADGKLVNEIVREMLAAP